MTNGGTNGASNAGTNGASNAGTHGEKAPLPLPWRWAVPAVAVLVATLVTGIVLYGWMPGRLPTHFGPGGQPDAWSDKSIGSAFGALGIQALVLVVIVLAGGATLRPRRGHTPRLSLVKALFVLAAGAQVTFLIASLAVWTVLPPGGYLLPLLLLPTALGLLVQLAEGVRAARKTRAAKRRGVQKGPAGGADKPSTAGEAEGSA